MLTLQDALAQARRLADNVLKNRQDTLASMIASMRDDCAAGRMSPWRAIEIAENRAWIDGYSRCLTQTLGMLEAIAEQIDTAKPAK